MRSLILERVIRWLLPISLLFAAYLLARGHDAPGGGFIAGLVSAGALMLTGLGVGVRRARRELTALLRPTPWVGLVLTLGGGGAGLVFGDPFLTHYHAEVEVGGAEVGLSTTLLFDIGVYCLVVGVTTRLADTFAERG